MNYETLHAVRATHYLPKPGELKCRWGLLKKQARKHSTTVLPKLAIKENPAEGLQPHLQTDPHQVPTVNSPK